jgi:hypothetical protein
LQAIPDAPPQVSVQLRGISSAITPGARIPVGGNVTDDYGLARITFDYQVDEGEHQTRDLSPPPGAAATYRVEHALDARQFAETARLAPQQKLRLQIKATDQCDLGRGPNTGISQTFTLDVVTPQQLRGLIDRRELLLRQQFETTIGELSATRDLLARLARDAPTGAGTSRPNGDAPAASTHDPMQRRLLTARVIQNVARSAHETVDVAEAFAEIRAELINNRIATESLKQRLKEGIADPLRSIGQRRLPAIHARIERIQPHVAPAEGDREILRDAIGQTDAVLVEMKAILSKMLELESFNEVLELLRSIIEEQDQLNQRTLERRKEQLRRLLED